MERMETAKWLKGITIIIGVVGLVFFLVLMPMMAEYYEETYPALAYLKWPGMIYGWGIGVLCYAVLFQFWKVCVEIGKDNSFSKENAKSFLVISRLTAVLAVVWFAGIVALAFEKCLVLSDTIFLLLIVFVFIVLAILAAALSHLIYMAYEMRRENELTI